MAWWHSAVVYQIYPRSFADSNGDGVGDLRGVIDHLDYLEQLGIDALWLAPVYPSPMVDNGYDITDYRDVDPLFGTLADLDELIAGVHARGIRVVMDLVVNHTSDQHPWFLESRNPNSAKRDWYIWQPARSGHEPGTFRAEPSNAGSAFGGPGWKYDPKSGEYYLHLFSPHQPDLNWENPELRAEIYRMMRWWVDRGVDGFRMDVINVISKTYPPRDGAAAADGLCYDVAMVANGPRLHEFLQEMNREVGISERELFTVGEMGNVDASLVRSYTADRANELGMVFTFEHVTLDQASAVKWDLAKLSLPKLKQTLASYQYGLADEGWNALYLENHDQPRSVSRFGDDSAEFRVASAKTIATTLHLLKGTPFIYQGEELGMTNAGFTSVGQYQDVESLGFYRQAAAAGMPAERVLDALSCKSRDNARTPMQWNAEERAGFTTGRPWLPINPNHVQINVAAELVDPESVWHHYRKLIALRHEEAVVTEGRFELLLPDDQRLFCFTRSSATDCMVVVANWSSSPVDLPSELGFVTDAYLVLGTHTDSGPGLAAWESRVYRSAKIDVSRSRRGEK
jgi:oligo-1,6-glucosidase